MENKILIAQSLNTPNEYYVFRPIGNNSYREIKFQITANKLIRLKGNILHPTEITHIRKVLF